MYKVEGVCPRCSKVELFDLTGDIEDSWYEEVTCCQCENDYRIDFSIDCKPI